MNAPAQSEDTLSSDLKELLFRELFAEMHNGGLLRGVMASTVFENVLESLEFSKENINILEMYYTRKCTIGYIAFVMGTTSDIIVKKLSDILQEISGQYPKLYEKLRIEWVKNHPEEAAGRIRTLEQEISSPTTKQTLTETDIELLYTATCNVPGISEATANYLEKKELLYIINLVTLTESGLLIALSNNDMLQEIKDALAATGLYLGMNFDKEVLEIVSKEMQAGHPHRY